MLAGRLVGAKEHMLAPLEPAADAVARSGCRLTAAQRLAGARLVQRPGRHDYSDGGRLAV